MDRTLEGLTGVACFFVDTLIKGSDLEKVHIRTKKVIDRLKRNDLYINKINSK